jgi:transposase
MPKTIKLESHLSSQELENRYRKAHDPVLRSHYQILWLISEGKTTSQVVEATGYSRGWIQQLARRYNRYGPGALGDRRHQNPGARERALLSAEQQEELREALKKPPPDVELPQGGRVDRAENRQSAKAQEAEWLGVHEEARAKPQGPQASSQAGQLP